MAEERTADAKRALRRALLAERRALPPDAVATASGAIVAALRTLPELAGASDVLLYAADPDEVDLDALLDAPPHGWRVLLPKVLEGELAAVPHHARAPLTVGPFGIREPAGDPVDPAGIDAVIVPGVAFTPTGQRLGRGAGMYDRLLPRTARAVRIGVCLEAFVRPELAVEPHDALVDVVITDASVRRRKDPGPAAPA
jgi:5-formyltetrahydrofolate cyclo-ligase